MQKQVLNQPNFNPLNKFEVQCEIYFLAVDHSVSLNDQSVVVDLLAVIILRPSIWNLDLCVSLLPPIGDLMQSKYEA